ncbi:MAG: carboxymuconolactone decarboxylase family protein [Dehalococcoidia bacterium]|nr:carboxymuconolactone decarboxylase family protein [Dehalococcoidia bacterium]
MAPLKLGPLPYDEISPKMREVAQDLIYNDIWERPQLSKRDRSLLTVASLVTTYRNDQLRTHLGRALDNGVTREEIGEALLHLAFYAGFPNATQAFHIAKEVFERRDAQGKG